MLMDSCRWNYIRWPNTELWCSPRHP